MEDEGKKKGKEQQEFKTDLFPERATTVQCPWHDLPLQIETENRQVEGKTVIVRFAVCKCRVPDNNSFGKRVWEQT